MTVVEEPDSERAALEPLWYFRLYVAGQSPKSVAAVSNLHRLIAQHVQHTHEVEVIDLADDPVLARSDDIIAIPTLVRRLPEPVVKVIGDLSDTDRLLRALDLDAGPAR